MRVATALTGMTLTAGAAGAIVATPAYAGTNGQQVEVCGLAESFHVIVSGPNQTGHNAVWMGHATGPCVTTTGWWFKGRVFLWATSADYMFATSKFCNVPTDYPENVYNCGDI